MKMVAMGGACSTRGSYRKCIQVYVGVDGKMVLKWILNKYIVDWIPD
jgi:hypothetical protein